MPSWFGSFSSRCVLSSVVEHFLHTEGVAGSKPAARTTFPEGQRAQLSPKYHYNRAFQLRRFAHTVPGYAVCDLGKPHLDDFLSSKPIAGFSAKSRNHHRTAITQFLSWCGRKDYLPVRHRCGRTGTEQAEPVAPATDHDSSTDGVADLGGKPDEIGKVFAGFQKYLYAETA